MIEKKPNKKVVNLPEKKNGNPFQNKNNKFTATQNTRYLKKNAQNRKHS